MSLAERDDLIPLARKVRVDARRNALQVVVEAALSLHTEREHEGQGHGARLRMREDEAWRLLSGHNSGCCFLRAPGETSTIMCGHWLRNSVELGSPVSGRLYGP